jgi:amino acid transporter
MSEAHRNRGGPGAQPPGQWSEAHRTGRDIPGGGLFWTAVVVGWSIILFGVGGALVDSRFTHPRSMAIWIVGCLIAHDFVLAPIVFGVGRVLRRVASGADRRLLQTCLVLFGVLFLVSIPVLGRFGFRPDNTTLLPRDYGVGLVASLGTVWLLTTATFLFIAWRRRHA